MRYSDVGIIFHTNERGQYDIKYETNVGPSVTEFEYYVDGKFLFIKNYRALSGYWLLIEKSKNKMVLEKSS